MTLVSAVLNGAGVSASPVRFCSVEARREAEDNGTNLGKQPPVFAPGEMIDDVQILIFERRSRLPTRHRRSVTTYWNLFLLVMACVIS